MRPPVHPGGLGLAAVSVLASTITSPGWIFGKYPNLAASLSRGEATAEQVGDASPAYLLLHLLASPTVIHVFQVLAAAATVVVLFEVLRRQGGLRAAWAGAGALALSQQWQVYAAVMEPDLLIGFLTACGIAALSGALTTRRLALAGLCLGLSVSLRPTGLLFAGLVAGWTLWKRAGLRPMAALGVTVVVAALLPAGLLRLRAGQDLRTTMSVGQVFHQSHRPESLGFGATFPALLKIVEAQAMATGPHPPDYAHELYRELARVSEPARVSAASTELYWLGRALAYFRLEPAAAASHLVDKLVAFLAPPAGEYDIPAVRPLLARSWGLPLRWLTLLGAGAVWLLGWRTRAAPLWTWHWLSALVVGLLFYFHGRYAVGAVPTLAALLGLGVAAAWSHRRWAWLLLAPAVVLLLPSMRWSDRMTERLGIIQAEASPGPESWEALRERYVEEQAALPDTFWPTAPHGVGVGEVARLAAARAEERYGVAPPVDATLAAALWADAGEHQKALALVDQATGFSWALGDRSVDPRLVASDALLALGRPREALTQLEAAQRARPGRLDVLARLVAAGDVGHATQLEPYERELFALHDAASARYALSQARRRWGDPQGALADADWLLAHWPRAAPFAEYERALCLLDLRRPEEALEARARALEIRAGLPDERRFDELILALTEAAPEEPRVKALALQHWRRRGDRARVQQLK